MILTESSMQDCSLLTEQPHCETAAQNTCSYGCHLTFWQHKHGIGQQIHTNEVDYTILFHGANVGS